MDEQKKGEDQSQEPTRDEIPSLTPTPAPSASPGNSLDKATIAELEKGMSRAERGMVRWSRVVAILTGALVLIGGFQVYSFIESERAFLIAKEVSFISVEPSAGTGGLDMHLVVKNVGKHTASVSQISVRPAAFIVQKQLDASPDYKGGNALQPVVVAPIVSEEEKPINLFEGGNSFQKSKDEVVGQINSGEGFFRVWGLIEYDIGYPSWRPGQLGFCFEFIAPPNRRLGQKWKTWDNSAYTYTR